MKQNSYNFWFRKGIAKNGTYYCQSCSDLKSGSGFKTSMVLDDYKVDVKVCEVCFLLAQLKPLTIKEEKFIVDIVTVR